MKIAKTVAKILVALAAVAGIIYVAATYGDKIVAWCKKTIASLPCCKETEFVEDADACCCGDECCCDGECSCEAEEAPAEIVEEVAEPLVEEADFEG